MALYVRTGKAEHKALRTSTALVAGTGGPVVVGQKQSRLSVLGALGEKVAFLCRYAPLMLALLIESTVHKRA